MNAPAHFKQRLAAELDAHAASLPSPAAARSPRSPRSPLAALASRRRIAFAVGLTAAAVTTAVVLPQVTGGQSTRQAAPAMRHSAPGPSGTPGATGTGDLNVVNAAYSLTSKAGGTVSVRLFDAKGAAGLEAALEEAGIPAKVLVPSAGCAASGGHHRPRGSLRKVVPPSGLHSDGTRDIDPGAIVPGDHLLFIPDTASGPVSVLATRLVRDVPHCVPAT